MNEELSILVQVINLYGRGLATLGNAIRLTAAGTHGAIDIARLKVMQYKLKLHYASTGTRGTMKLSDLEKLTGENYSILNIPLESDNDLTHFYDALKRAKVSFSELPDLCIGDSYTQIAYDPQDRDKIRAVVDVFKKMLADKPTDMSIDEYVHTGGKEGEELLNSLAVKGYERETAEELIAGIQERNHDPAYTAIAINRQSMLVRETKGSYFFKVPKMKTYDGTTYAIRVEKSDAVYIDGGKTLITHIKENSGITVFSVDEEGKLYTGLSHTEQGYDIASKFSEVPRRTIEKINQMTISDTDMLPDFTRGQDQSETARRNAMREKRESSNMGDYSLDLNNNHSKSLDSDDINSHSMEPADTYSHSNKSTIQRNSSKNIDKAVYKSENSSSDINQRHTHMNEPTPQEQLSNLLKYEQLKDMYMDENHLIADINLEDNLIAKGPSQYIVALPGDWGDNEVYVVGIDKTSSVISDDGRYLRSFIHKDKDLLVSRLHANGKPGGEFVLSGEDVVKCLGGYKQDIKIGEMAESFKHGVSEMHRPIKHNL